MPEVLEVEAARRVVGPLVTGARVRRVVVTDPLVVGPGVDELIGGVRLLGLDRVGKQLVLVTERGPVGVHFGMTGRWLVDDVSTVGELAYGSRTTNARWDRWALDLTTGPTRGRQGVRLTLHDPRRLARVVVAPNVARLGPDALTLTRDQLAAALGRRAAPLKAVLLDQTAVAGLGNLLVDEVLWWAGLDPYRPARSLSPDEVRVLHAQIRRRLPVLMRRGGSHTGVLSPEVRAVLGGPCPRDGAPLRRVTVGGRTTVWCSAHQV